MRAFEKCFKRLTRELHLLYFSLSKKKNKKKMFLDCPPPIASKRPFFFFEWLREKERWKGKKKDFFMFYGSAPLAIGNWVFIPSDQKILGKADEVKKKNHGRHTAVASGVFKNKKCVKIKKNRKRGIDQKEKKKKKPRFGRNQSSSENLRKYEYSNLPPFVSLPVPFPLSSFFNYKQRV